MLHRALGISAGFKRGDSFIRWSRKMKKACYAYGTVSSKEKVRNNDVTYGEPRGMHYCWSIVFVQIEETGGLV